MITHTQTQQAPQRPIHTITTPQSGPAKPLFSRREVRRLVAAMLG